MLSKPSTRSRTATIAAGLFVVAIAASLWGCRDLEVQEPFPCSTARHCPAPYQCGTDNMCRRAPVDGGLGGAGGAGGSAAGTGGRGGAAGGVAGAGGSVQGGRGGQAGGAGQGGSGGSGGTGGSAGQGGSAGSAGQGGAGGRGGSGGSGGTAGTGGTGGAGGSAAGAGGRGGSGGTGGGGGAAGGRGGAGGAPLVNGQACSTDTQCQSMYCADGVCCESPCQGTCAACAMSKTGQASGLCRPIPDGQNPDNECGSGATCAVGGNGAAVLTPAAACNGVNACRPGTQQNCAGGFGCASASACRTSCSVHGDCAAGYYCMGTVCVAKKGVGVSCGGAAECASTFCVDSVCCSTSCPLAAAGAGCMACSSALTGMQNGTCAPRQGAATRACPTTNPTTCVDVQSDANNCSVCGNICSSSGMPAGTARACLFGQCDFACTTSGTALYTDGSGVRSCRRTTWDFESPPPAPFGVDGWENSNETRIELVNTHRSGNAGVALYASFLDMYPAHIENNFRDATGNLGTLDLRGKTFSAWIMVAVATPSSMDYCRIQGRALTAPYDIFLGPTSTKMQPPGGTNNWFELRGTFGTTSMEAQVNSLWIICKLPTSWAEDDTRRWYVDDISVY